MNYIISVALLAGVTLLNRGGVHSQVLKIEDLEYYYDLEEKLVANVQDYLKQQRENLQLLKQRYESHKWTEGQLSDLEKEEYLANPLNVHALIRRLTTEWPLTLALLNDEQHGMMVENEEDLDKQRQHVLPSPDEYAEAVRSLGRLQRVYNMTVAELAELAAGEPSSRLTGSDCYSIGQSLYEKHDYRAAIEWFKEALKLFGFPKSDEQSRGGEPVERTLEYLSLAFCFAGERKRSNFYFQKLYTKYSTFYPTLELISDHLSAMGGGCVNATRKPHMDINIANLTLAEQTNLTRDYEKLCRGGGATDGWSLRCHISDLGQPHFRLAPARIEPLKLDPPLTMVHGLFSPATLDSVWNNLSNKNQKGLVSETWRRVSGDLRRLVEVTPLLTHHDNIAVLSSYAAGTEQRLHHDAITQLKGLSTSDRVATMMIYVQEPRSGGELVFPHLGLTVAPPRGSVLLWYNLDPMGYPDPWATYGACPIRRGHKTTITTWLVDKALPTCVRYSVHDYKGTVLYKLLQPS